MLVARTNTAASATDAGVLRDHLKQRQHRAEPELLVTLGRHFDEPHRKRRVRRYPAQLGHAPLIGRRVPLDDDDFSVQRCTPALCRERVDEGLKALQRIAAVIVVSCGNDDAQIRRCGR
jgi:hypothetical protein